MMNKIRKSRSSHKVKVDKSEGSKMLNIVKRFSLKSRKDRIKLSKLMPRKTLHKILNNKCYLIEFREFLVTERSEENVDFWLQCELYKCQKGAKQFEMAGKIFETYIATNSKCEVNLNFQIRKEIETLISNPDEKIFDVAQDYIFNLMEKDSLRRFLAREQFDKGQTLSKKKNVKEIFQTDL